MKLGVTGLGLLSALGQNEITTLESFRQGKRNAGKVTLFESEINAPVFEVKDFERHYFSERLRTLNLSLAATEDALNQAGLWNKLKGKRVGVAMGTTIGSILNDLDFYREYRSKGYASMDAVDRFLEGNLSEAIHSFLKTRGPSMTVVNACASGTDAIGVAMSWLRTGLCDIAIAGGADEMNRVPLCGFHSLSILSDKLCQPFDKNRNGLNLGEGAGILVIENEESMKSRSIAPRVYLKGYGTANDAHHLTAPDPAGRGLSQAISDALADATLNPSDISFINAHGTATNDNDAVEGQTLAKFFGDKTPFLSTKGYTGHTLGAAGALETGFSLLALEKGWLPTSVGFEQQDDEIGISPNCKIMEIESKYALSTSLGFGGCDAALILEANEGDQS